VEPLKRIEEDAANYLKEVARFRNAVPEIERRAENEKKQALEHATEYERQYKVRVQKASELKAAFEAEKRSCRKKGKQSPRF